MQNPSKRSAANMLIGASIFGIGAKLIVLLLQAHVQEGYVILPPFPNLLDAIIVAAAGAWLLALSVLQLYRR